MASHIGRRVVKLSPGLNVALNQGSLAIKGPKGELSVPLKPFVRVKIDESKVSLSVQEPENTFQRAMWGTTNALVKNAVEGEFLLIY